MKKLQLLLVLMVLGVSLKAQVPSGVLMLDSGRHYAYEQIANANGASKDVLYARLKSWIENALNPSDTYLRWDESNHEAVETIAFLEMPNSQYYINQIVEFKVQVTFADGVAVLRAQDFIFHGTSTNGSREIDTRLERAGRLGEGANYTMAEFDGYFKLLMESFVKAARGRKK